MTEEELRNIANSAVAGFWSLVKKSFPHAKGDKIDQGLAQQLGHAARLAVEDWCAKNDRDDWTDVGTVVRVSFADNPLGEERLAFVWDSDFNSFRTWAELRVARRHRIEGGMAKLKYEADRWMLISPDYLKRPVTVARCEDPRFRIWLDPADRTVMVVGEVIDGSTEERMRIDLPTDFNKALCARDSLRRLVGELNMAHQAIWSK
jgi:hypothetical protein